MPRRSFDSESGTEIKLDDAIGAFIEIRLLKLGMPTQLEIRTIYLNHQIYIQCDAGMSVITDYTSAFRSYLPGLHLLCPSAEGHVRVASARAISLLLLDKREEAASLADFPLAAPVVKHLLDQLIVLFQ